jgi:hypothetical protein
MIHPRPDLPAVDRDLVAILAAALVADYRADQARKPRATPDGATNSAARSEPAGPVIVLRSGCLPPGGPAPWHLARSPTPGPPRRGAR